MPNGMIRLYLAMLKYNGKIISFETFIESNKNLFIKAKVYYPYALVECEWPINE